MDDDTITKMRDRINQYSSLVRQQLSVFRAMEAGLAKEHIQELATLQQELAGLKAQWAEAPYSQSVEGTMTIRIPFLETVISTTQAAVQASLKENKVDTRTKYALSLAADGTSLDGMADVVAVYHQAINDFLALQREFKHYRFEPVQRADAASFKRHCETLLYTLDRFATQRFGREIHTPADIDPRERNPNQFLGDIRIGFQNVVPELVGVLSHEGSFGHQVHRTMSTETEFNLSCTHLDEGLAIFGEYLGTELYCKLHPEKNQPPIAELFRQRRLVTDSVGAAIEKLLFYDKLSADQIAHQLWSEIYSHEILVEHLAEQSRHLHSIFTTQGSFYFIGGQQVPKMYNAACAALNETADSLSEQHTAILRVMFMGDRPATIMGAHLDHLVKHYKEQKK